MAEPITDFTAEELAKVVGYEPDEVKLNSAGKYSQRQIKRLRRWILVYIPLAMFAIFILVRNTECLRTVGCLTYYAQQANIFTLVRYIGGLIGLVVVFLVTGIVILRVVTPPAIKSYTGLMITHTGWATPFKPYAMHVKGMGFVIGWATRRLKMPAEQYEGYVKVYYFDLLPFISRPILSIELLDDVASAETATEEAAL